MRRQFALLTLVALPTLVVCSSASGTAKARHLKAVWLKGGRIHATYRVPAGMVPYKMQFYAPSRGWASQTYYLFPWDNDYGGAQVDNRHWLSTKSDESILVSQTTYVVRLFYGAKTRCVNVGKCPHPVRSNPIILKAGAVPTTFGPGSLVQAASGYGDFASASVSATVKNPNKFTVRVSSTPSSQSVHIAWDVTCTKGASVRGASGSWDDYTPVNDGSSIQIPFATVTSNPDQCVIAVGATLEVDPGATETPSGTLTLRLYVDKSHL